MEQGQLTRPQRRALNIIWTAAGDYSFTPAFTAFLEDGEPDLYMNAIIGYVHKWYDPAVMEPLFDQISRSFFSETLDGLLWVALENCAFEKEAPLRPVLAELRAAHARDFFDRELTRSRQQWMAQNSLVYALQAARCRVILGRDPGLVSPWERSLFEALQLDGSLTAGEVASQIRRIFRRYFPASGWKRSPAFVRELRRKLNRFLIRKMPSRLVRTDTLLMTGPAGREGILLQGRRGLDAGRRDPAAQRADRLYIEGCFGLPLYPDDVSARIDQALCTGAHENCHLYFTAGQKSTVPPRDGVIEKVLRDAAWQMQKNRAHFQSRRLLYKNSTARLTEQIRSSLLVHAQPVPLRSRSGAVCPSQVWRGLYLHDPRIFQDSLEETDADFSVDLMLDASASRLQDQEVIAAQGCVIARSLQACRIPVQVFSFLSVRGYTVLQRFLGYEDMQAEDTQRIFRYFAAGWNRDGLALRGAGQLMKDAPAKNRLLIILTDGSPNDDRRIPADPGKRQFVSQDYAGKAGIADTAAEARALRRQGVHLCGILTGSGGDTHAAREIFGNDFVRIEKMERFADAAGVLIRRQIEKLTTG